MKFRAPPHCAVVVHGGVQHVVDSDGSIDAPDTEAAHLLAHGLRPWLVTPPPSRPPRSTHRQDIASTSRDIEAMSRRAVVAALKRLGRPASPSARTPDLRRALRKALAARA